MERVAVKSADEVEKALEAADRKADERRARRVAFEQETAQMLADADAALTESIQSELDAQLEAEWDALQEEKRIQQQRVDVFLSYASALSNITDALADIYEANDEADEEAAKKAKALRTAGAIISTISGAVSAFTSTWSAAELPYTAKIFLAPLNAAAVLAAGYAQVKQINAVKVGSGGVGSAVVPAPSFPSSVPAVRNVTGRSEEERLNRMADKQRVVVVWSDIEAKQDEDRVQIDETTW